MTIPANFVAMWEYLHPESAAQMMLSKTIPKGKKLWVLKNEIRPSDLYCYFWARFGAPNGLQNFLRKDDSDNLIHWDWMFKTEFGFLTFLGMNFRTEVHLFGDYPFDESDKVDFLRQVKADFENYGSKMSEVRDQVLESWIEFANPYQRLKRSIITLFEELNSLSLDPDKEEIKDHSAIKSIQQQKDLWEGTASRYSKGFGLCFGIRSMLPIMAEAFVNMLLFILMKPELKEDKRLKENLFRQPIDIRIKSFHINCVNFNKAVDYTNEVCRQYHTLVNERNDLLHGNVAIEKLKFSELYFHGRLPVYKEYRSMWQRSLGVDLEAVGLKKLGIELEIVNNLIAYILSCIDEAVRDQIEAMLEIRDLGFNTKTGKLGILFPDYLVDICISTGDNDKDESPDLS